MKQSLRIIGGQYRGKKIDFPDQPGLRPTPDRVRETLFNWLMHDIQGARCLDAFAGSGALGLEALSRGAASVTLIEHARPVAAHLRQQLQKLGNPRIELISMDSLAYLRQCEIPFDIIFLDPPFASDFLAQSLALIEGGNCLGAGGLVYIETDQALLADPAGWQVLKRAKAGQVYYALMQLAVDDTETE